MDSIVFRDFIPSDTNSLKTLIHEFLKEESFNNPLRLTEPKEEFKHKYFEKVMKEIDENSGRVIIAEDNNQIVGFIFACFNIIKGDDLLEFKEIKEGCIEDIYVIKTHRRMGIGNKLMNLALKYLKESDCDIAKLYVQSKNEKAYNLYKKLGFENNVRRMIKIFKPI